MYKVFINNKTIILIDDLKNIKTSYAYTFHHDVVNKNLFEPEAQDILLKISQKYNQIYSRNVIASQNKKLLMDYKVPYGPQLELNELELLKAKIVLEQLQRLQK